MFYNIRPPIEVSLLAIEIMGKTLSNCVTPNNNMH
jgi:hypothetical protein